MDDTLFLDTLRQYWGYDGFRGIQPDIIRSIASGTDTLGLMPTGGGKSISFQVPALTMDGVCIVITPLIALMKDQVEHLKAVGISAEAIHSGRTNSDVQRIFDNAIFGAVKFLYISPERISNRMFQAKLAYMKVCFIVVDEAHCISQWGYDFRPSYLAVGNIRQLKPEAPVLALTATATPIVVDDIQDKLLFGQFGNKQKAVFSMSFKRDNLSYVVRYASMKIDEALHILRSVPGTAILYTRNRKNTKDIALRLQEEGISATYYHAGLDVAIKNQRQKDWQENKVRVMVSTNAFGMGIDKPDVRLVIHMDVPDSLEAYFQEAGRGGRDGKRSYAVLLHDSKDIRRLNMRVSQQFPPKEYIRLVYDHLCYFFELAVETGEGAHYMFDDAKFCLTFKHHPAHLEPALSILQRAGYIDYDSSPDIPPRIKLEVVREQLYHIEGLSKLQDELFQILLRNYGALFVEYVYIDDSTLARKLGIDEHQLHAILKELRQRGIISYVPRLRMPLLTFTRDRVASERLVLDKAIYEQSRERMTERVGAVISYFTTNDTCRQNALLTYFGEKSDDTCGHCDVCIELKRDAKQDLNSAISKVKALLADFKPHRIEELQDLPLPTDLVSSAVDYLQSHGLVTVNFPQVTLIDKK